jgi:hypothetical protein
MTTVAHFQPLTWFWWYHLTGWMVGLLRVYSPGHRYPSSKYKFKTTVVITRWTDAYLHGLLEDEHKKEPIITRHEFSAMDRCLHRLGCHEVKWTHNGVEKTHILRG